MSKMKKISWLLMGLLFISLWPNTVKAEELVSLKNNYPISVQVDPLDDTKNFMIQVTKLSTVKLSIKSTLNYLYSSLENSKGEQMDVHWDFDDATSSKPRTWSTSYHLKPGEYYVRIKNDALLSGKYIIEAKQTSLSTNEIEPNNTMKKAQPILPNTTKIKGTIGWNDSIDLFKVTNVKKYATLEVIVTSTMPTLSAKLMNDKYRVIFNNNIFGSATVAKPTTWKKSARITKGDYYVVIESSVATFGQYTITTKISEMLPPAPTVKKIVVGSKKITGQSINSSKMTVKINNKYYYGTTNSKGVYTIKVPIQKRNTKVFVRVTSNYGTSEYKEVVVGK